MVFNNIGEAKGAVFKENQWSYYYTNTTVEGKKTFLRSNKVKRRGIQCDAGIYLLLDSTTDEFILFRDKSAHTHDRVGTRDPAISNEVKEAIKDLFQLKLKPKAILEALYECVRPAGHTNRF